MAAPREKKNKMWREGPQSCDSTMHWLRGHTSLSLNFPPYKKWGDVNFTRIFGISKIGYVKYLVTQCLTLRRGLF